MDVPVPWFVRPKWFETAHVLAESFPLQILECTRDFELLFSEAGRVYFAWTGNWFITRSVRVSWHVSISVCRLWGVLLRMCVAGRYKRKVK